MPIDPPPHDLGAVFDAHVGAELVAHDVDATMRTMTDDPHVTHVPTLTGGAAAAKTRPTNALMRRWSESAHPHP